MKKYLLRLNFLWDDEDDTQEFVIEVPESVTIEKIREIFLRGHKYLCMEDSEDFYGTMGRTPTTLLDYVCNRNGWRWQELSFDIDMNLD